LLELHFSHHASFSLTSPDKTSPECEKSTKLKQQKRPFYSRLATPIKEFKNRISSGIGPHLSFFASADFSAFFS
jgi:hypothetical protein